jgi:hypothetical protein
MGTCRLTFYGNTHGLENLELATLGMHQEVKIRCILHILLNCFLGCLVR